MCGVIRRRKDLERRMPSRGPYRQGTPSRLVILTGVSRPSRRRGKAGRRRGVNGPKTRLRAPGCWRWHAVPVFCPQAGRSPPLPVAAGNDAGEGPPQSASVGGEGRGVHRPVGGSGTTEPRPREGTLLQSRSATPLRRV